MTVTGMSKTKLNFPPAHLPASDTRATVIKEHDKHLISAVNAGNDARLVRLKAARCM